MVNCPLTTPVRLSRFCYNNAHVAKRKKVVHVILKGDCGKGGFLAESCLGRTAEVGYI